MQLQTSQTLQKEAPWKDDKTKTFDSVSKTITRSAESYNFPPLSKDEGWGDKASLSALPTLLRFLLEQPEKWPYWKILVLPGSFLTGCSPSLLSVHRHHSVCIETPASAGSCVWAPGSLCFTWICSEPGGEHPELFLQLERWHSLLRLGAPLLPRRVWVFNPQPLQAQRKLPAGFQHRRVSSYSFCGGSGRSSPGICTGTEWFHGSTCVDLSVRLALCPQEAGRLPPSAGPRRPGADERARLEMRLHVHPRVLPLPGGERPGQNKEAIIGTSLWFRTRVRPCRNVSCGQNQTLGTFLNVGNFLRQKNGMKGTCKCKRSIQQTIGVMAVTYWCLCALSGHLAPRISAFHWDYTSAIIPVRAIKIWGLILSGCWAV